MEKNSSTSVIPETIRNYFREIGARGGRAGTEKQRIARSKNIRKSGGRPRGAKNKPRLASIEAKQE